MRLPSSASASSSSSAPSSPTSFDAVLPAPAPKPRRRRTDKVLTAYPLQRGSACLSCRKRKMKCDAGKPSCSQCVKANRSGDCDYDDGKSKSRTQLLQDKISMLEGRIRELEGPALPPAAPPPARQPDAFPPVLYDHVVPGMFASTAAFDLSTALSTTPPPASAPSPWISNQYDLHVQTPPDSLQWDIDALSMTPEDLLKSSGRWWEHAQPPQGIRQLMLDIFLPHRHQCGFEVDVRRFQASLASPDPPHSALLNAIYALACHFSLSPLLSPHEPRFVARALRAVSDALEASESLVDVLRASCLLAVLFFIKGRLLEGYYHAGAAARLAVGLGLHQLAAPKGSGDSSSGSDDAARPSGAGAAGPSILPPPADTLELGERVLAFWQVFCLDRCWAVAMGLPVALADDGHPRMRIETAWPRALEDYEIGNVGDADYSTVHYLYAQGATLPYPAAAPDAPSALRAKASALFERAARLAASFGGAEQFWADFHAVDGAIARLAVRVPPARADADAALDHVLFAVHVLLHAATLQLHAPFVLKDGGAQQKSAGAAARAVALVHELGDADYAFLDPVLGTCWTSVAEALVHELIVLRAPPRPGAAEQAAAVNRQLDVVVGAMNRLGATVPLAAYQASQVEQSRGVTL